MHTKISEVTTVRPKKRPASIKPSLLLELAGHAAMGVASGLAFAFLVTHIGTLGVATLISYSPNPSATLLTFVGTCATTFGIGATLTGLVITLTEEDGTTGCK
jgi:hypothetical protein